MVLERAHNEGFTLVEVLLAVAVALVLLGVALPSIFSSQRNLLLDEANASASAIANAAQAEMTSKKVDGTWASLVRQSSGEYKEEFPLAEDADDTHLRYMTAQTARDLGIITSLSVEKDVRDACYIIEFNGLTASVTRVFYSTGSNGFFSLPLLNAKTQATVLDYYQNAPSEDDSAYRLSYHGCTIGLFEGTPDGATPSAALVNPSVSANDYGKIVLTNPNLVDADTGTGVIENLTTEVVFSYPMDENTTYTLKISGMTKNYTGDTYTVTASDGENEYECSFSNAPASNSGIYTVEGNTRFELDLNALALVLEDHTSQSQVKAVWEIVEAMQDLSHAEAQSKLEAVCTTVANGCMPVSGRAFVDWPAAVPTLKVYVTDPDPEHVDTLGLGLDSSYASTPSFISGSYTSPDVALVDENRNAVSSSVLNYYTGLVSETMLKSSFSLSGAWVNGESGNATKLPVRAGWFNTLQKENVQEGSQSYSGKTIKIDTANSIDADVLVTVGSYTSNSSSTMTMSNSNGGTITYDGKTITNAFRSGELPWPTDAATTQRFSFTGATHAYQIYEVWLNDGENNRRVGYFEGDTWKWDDDILRDCVKPLDANGNITSTITESTTRLLIDSSALMGKAAELSKYQNYSLYIRTAPKASEALDWFDEYSLTFAKYLASRSNTTDPRGENYARPIRWLFENEFGASSTVATWTITGKDENDSSMKDQVGQQYPATATTLRIYYTALPALAWNTSSSLDSRFLALPNAQLMIYEFDSRAGTLEKVSFEDDAQSIYSHQLSGYASFQVRATSTADIAIVPQFDQLFYRVLVYFDEDGTTRFSSADLDEQFTILPLDGFDDDLRFPLGPNKDNLAFYGWRMTTTNGTVIIGRDADGQMPKISDYLDQMKYGATSLTAIYREGSDERVGLLYVDNYDEGALHYTGYASIDAAFADDVELSQSSLSVTGGSFESGYYVSYLMNSATAPQVDLTASAAYSAGYTVSQTPSAYATIDGNRYALYKLSFDASTNTQQCVRVRVWMKGAQYPSGNLYCNSVFGGMIANIEDTAKTFGRTSYPWRVYAADSFPGVVQSNLQDQDLTYTRSLLENNSNTSLSTNNYVQMRNLDFAQFDASSLKQWPVAFYGTYDGNGLTIRNAQNGFTKAPVSGGNSISKCGTSNVGSEANAQVAEGLFPAVVGKDKNNPASISGLTVEVTDCRSDASLFAVLTGFGKQASYRGIKIVGKPSTNTQDKASITLSGLGKLGTTDVFYAAGPLVGRAESCFLLEDCSAQDIAFTLSNANFELAYNRNVLGGLVGIFDFASGTASSVQTRTTNLSAQNIAFTMDASCKVGKNGSVSYGGMFGRLYVRETLSFNGLDWTSQDISIVNASDVPDTSVYVGIVAASTGGNMRAFKNLTDYSNVTYVHADKTLDLVALFDRKVSVASNGQLSGVEWCYLNAKKASDALTEAAKKTRDADPASIAEEPSSDASTSGSAQSASSPIAPTDGQGAAGGDSSAQNPGESTSSAADSSSAQAGTTAGQSARSATSSEGEGA